MLSTVPRWPDLTQRRPQAMVAWSVPMSTIPITESKARGENGSGARGRVGRGFAGSRSRVAGFAPPPSAGHGCMERAQEHDTDYGIEGAGEKIFGAGDEFSARVFTNGKTRRMTPAHAN